MDRTLPVLSSSVEVQPPSEWVRDDKSETIVVKLAGFGFRKEHIKVQIDNYRNLRTSGERPADGDRWIRFRKDFIIPDSLDISQIRAKFENGNLYVVMPKLIITQAETQVPPRPQEPVAAATKPEAQPDVTQKDTTGKVAKPEAQPDMTQKTTNGKVTKPEAQPETAQKATSGRQDTKPEETALEKEEEKEKVKAPFEEPLGTAKGEDVDEWKKEAEAAAKEKVSGAQGCGVGAQIGKWPEKAMAGVGGMVQGLKGSPRQLLVNIGVAVMVLVTLGLYMTYKLKKATVAESD